MRNLLKFALTFCLVLCASVVLAQGNVSGNVVDSETGTPLPGVNVVIQGTSTGVSSDFDGNYQISVPQGAVLEFSFIGFENQSITVNGDQINVAMVPSADTLDEIVVTGYGTQTRREVTGSIVSIGSESIEKIATGSGVDAIKGQVAGVDITSGGGRPGQNPVVRVRGRRSISASNDPLYVIDGIPQTSSTGDGAIFDINPQDIESMEILKDAAATAIYGSRGANGVILITTKRGRTGATKINYSGYYGITSVTNVPDMMNGEEYAAGRREAFRQDANNRYSYSGTIPNDEAVFLGDAAQLESIRTGRSFDYLDAVLNQGYQNSHQLSANGGSENTQYNVSLGYFKEDGIIDLMDFERITGRLNLDHRINDRFKFGISMLLSNSVNNWGSSAVMSEALSNIPIGKPYADDGTLNFFAFNDGIRTNPLSELVPGAYVDERISTRFFAPVYLQINLMEGLQFTSTFGPDMRFRRRGEFRDRFTNDNRGGPADAEVENKREFGFTLENLVTFNKEVGPGNLKVTLLQSIQEFSSEFAKSEVQNLPYSSQLWYNIGTAEVKGNLSSGLSEWQLQSYMGRVNYNIDGKYLFQASLRADGSSRLAEGNKWAYFPGVSIGWRMLEDIAPDSATFDEFKLRASYGEVGNTAIDPYQTQGALARTVYAWNETPAFGYRLNDIPNPNLGWEISKTIDVGFDYSLLDGRISGAFDYYVTNTTDLLLARNLPYTSGYTSVFQNVGATKTNGVEFNVNASLIETDKFAWDLNLNVSGYNEKIVELALKDENGIPLDDTGNNWFIGQPIRVFFDYTKSGIWQLNEADQAAAVQGTDPGQIKLADIDGDGKITPADRSVIGTDVPDYFGGITNTFTYGNFDLSAFFYFRQGHMIRSSFHQGNANGQFRYNHLDVDYWTPTNPTNEYPRPNFTQERPENGSTLEYFDGSYVKLRNVTLGYNFESATASKFGMTSLRAYVQGQNLWFSSEYDTFDPEVGEATLGSGTTPSSKLIAFGIRAAF
jgi:TonB-linked SusC/RagA family outer membrane protein